MSCLPPSAFSAKDMLLKNERNSLPFSPGSSMQWNRLNGTEKHPKTNFFSLGCCSSYYYTKRSKSELFFAFPPPHRALSPANLIGRMEKGGVNA